MTEGDCLVPSGEIVPHGSTVLFETDWLASRPVFYDERSGTASRNINDVIDLADMEFDPDGFNDYLDFGFSVFQQTPVKGVKFMPPSSRLLRGPDGKLVLEPVEDRVPQLLTRSLTEPEVLEVLRAKIAEIERTSQGPLVIPTSGGNDSRLLNLMVGDRERIRSFTYGTCEDQSRSYEVARARALSHLLGTEWAQVELGDFHRYFDDWDRVFGVSTHAHGMYQIEFYKRIRGQLGSGCHVLSGLDGDWWEGMNLTGWMEHTNQVRCPADVPDLIVTHKMHSDSSVSRFKGGGAALEPYFEEKREALCDPKLRVIELVRLRVVLLSYLVRVPESLGFVAHAPYHDIDVALAMLQLPESRRRERQWVRDCFDCRGVDPDDSAGSHENTLNLQASRRIPLTPLSEELLAEVVDPRYVRWVNRHAGRLGTTWAQCELRVYRRPFRRALDLVHSRHSPAYVAYLVLKPIEALIRRRDAARRGRTP